MNVDEAWRSLPATVLAGRHVRLEPVGAAHAAGLAEAVRDGELWKLNYTRIPSPEMMPVAIAHCVAQREAGTMAPFAAIALPASAVAGMTSYMNIDRVNRRVEIGATWYRASAQRTALNTEAKLLLLEHAFEALDCIAVELRTSHLNARSRAAIERLGAKRDGILRSHQFHADGSLRDTVVYSIVAAEWPAVRENVIARRY